MPGSRSLPSHSVRQLVLILAVLGLLVLVVTFAPLDSWWAEKLAGGWNHPQGDVLIVLGGAEGSSDGIIGWDSYVRSVYAVRAYRERGFPVILLSGAGSPISVASSMREFLQSQGVPAGVLRVEERSWSTRENALYTAEILKGVAGRKVLLTSDYHIYRARRAFRKAGLEVAPHPIPDAFKRAGSLRGRWWAFLDLVGETVKILYYFARGWI